MSKKVKESLLDQSLSYLFPRWGVKRAMWREAASVHDSSRSGRRTRLDENWPSAQSLRLGQTTTDLLDIQEMRSRAYQVMKKNPLGRGMIERVVDNVIGEGMILIPKTDSKDFNAEVKERFAEWMDRADMRGIFTGAEIQRHMQRAYERDGDVGMVRVVHRGKPRLQLVRAARINTPDRLLGDDNVKDGIRMDKWGKPLKFYVGTHTQSGVTDHKIVDAHNFIYYPRMDDFDDVRGTSAFGPIFPLLGQIDGYIDAVVIAARMAAVFGLIMKGANSNKQFSNLPTIQNSQGDAQKAVTLEDGMVKYMGQQDDVVQVQAQQPMEQTPQFIAVLVRLLGVPFAMPLELTLLDFSQTNLSSARVAILQFYRAMMGKQQSFNKVVMTPIYRWWLAREIKTGVLTTKEPELWMPHQFQPRGWQWLDPLKDQQAALLELSMGITTKGDIAAGLGRDIEDIMVRRAAELAIERIQELPEVFSTLTRESQANKMAKQPVSGEQKVVGTRKEGAA